MRQNAGVPEQRATDQERDELARGELLMRLMNAKTWFERAALKAQLARFEAKP